jgi:hypothetical protein
MDRQHRRLIFAALLSTSVFGLNLFWYEKTNTSEDSQQNLKPLAYVGKTIDEIQRKPTAKLLWQLINSGDPIYDGEAIRTGPQGEVRIELAETNSFIDLEPESLIVLKRGQGEISLDLLEGNLYVASEKTENILSAPNLVLNSPQGKVQLNKAKATLSANKSGKVEVQIHEGKASLKSKSGRTEDIQAKSDIRILSPSSKKPIILNAGKLEPILFEWEGFDRETEVTLLVGTSRKNLRELGKAKKGEKSLFVELPIGRTYWKLVGKKSDGSSIAESATYKSDLVVRFPPTIIFPEPNSTIQAGKDPWGIKFRWANQQSINKTQLLLSMDPELRDLLISKNIEKANFFVAEGLKPGMYYWKLVHQYADSQRPIESSVVKFTVLERQQDQNSSLAESKVKIQFNPTSLNTIQTYPEELFFKLDWSAENKALVKKWRLHLFEENSGPETSEAIELTDSNVNKKISRPGRYVASIEALDQKGRILASTQSPTIAIEIAPFLSAPQWTESNLKQKIYDNEQVEFKWTTIEGAQNYIFVMASNDKQVKKITVKNNSVNFTKLQPGIYEAHVYAIDSYERAGNRAAVKKLEVIRKPEMRAPALKKIKVN